MSSSPREKDAWIDALKKVLGDKFAALAPPPVIVEEIKKTGSNLERSDSRRSEVKSAPLLDHSGDNTAFMRSYSAGATLSDNKPNRTESSSPSPDRDTQRVSRVDIHFFSIPKRNYNHV